MPKRKLDHDESSTASLSLKERRKKALAEAQEYYRKLEEKKGSKKAGTDVKSPPRRADTSQARKPTPKKASTGRKSAAQQEMDDLELPDGVTEVDMKQPAKKRARRTSPSKSERKKMREENLMKMGAEFKAGTLFKNNRKKPTPAPPMARPPSPTTKPPPRRKPASAHPFNSPMPLPVENIHTKVDSGLHMPNHAEPVELSPSLSMKIHHPAEPKDSIDIPVPEDDEDDIVVDDEEDGSDDDDVVSGVSWKTKAWTFLKTTNALILLSLLVGVFACMSACSEADAAEGLCSLTSFPTKPRHSVDCFIDSSMEGEAAASVIQRCAKVPSSDWVKCPEVASCRGGVIVECLHAPYFEPDSAGSTCVATGASEEVTQLLSTLLAKWTVADICDVDGNAYTQSYASDSGHPQFLFTQLMGEIEMGMSAAIQQVVKTQVDIFELQSTEGSLETLVSLHKSYPLDYPGVCSVKMTMRSFFETLFNFLMAVISEIFGWLVTALGLYWELFTEIPIATLCVTVVVPSIFWFVSAYMKARGRRKKMKDQVAEYRVLMREAVYKRLKAKPGYHQASIHIRDEILFDPSLPFHSSISARRLAMNDVWPHVVTDVATDNRISRSQMTDGGKRRLCWCWDAE